MWFSASSRKKDSSIEFAPRLQRVHHVVRVGRDAEAHRNVELRGDRCAGQRADVGHAQMQDVGRTTQPNGSSNAALDRRQVFPALVRSSRRSGIVAEGHHRVRQGDAARRQRPGHRVGDGATPNREHVGYVVPGGQRLSERHQQTGDTTRVAATPEAELTVETTRQHQLRNPHTVRAQIALPSAPEMTGGSQLGR